MERIITTETPSSIKISRAEAYESVNAPEIIIRKDFERSFPEINIFETPDRIQTRKREEEIDKTEEVYRDANSLRLDYPYIYEYAEINDISIRPRKFKDFSLDEKTPKKSKKRKTKTSTKYRLVSSYVPSAKDLFPSITRTKPKSNQQIYLEWESVISNILRSQQSAAADITACITVSASAGYYRWGFASGSTYWLFTHV